MQFVKKNYEYNEFQKSKKIDKQLKYILQQNYNYSKF